MFFKCFVCPSFVCSLVLKGTAQLFHLGLSQNFSQIHYDFGIGQWCIIAYVFLSNSSFGR